MRTQMTMTVANCICPSPRASTTQSTQHALFNFVPRHDPIYLHFTNKELGARAAGGWRSWDWNSACHYHSGHDIPIGEGPQAQQRGRQQAKAPRPALDGWLLTPHVNLYQALPGNHPVRGLGAPWELSFWATAFHREPKPPEYRQRKQEDRMWH